MEGIPVEGIVALVGLGIVGAILVLSKIFAKFWAYLLLATPSWTTTLYGVADAIMKGESTGSILINHCVDMIFILSPIDQYLVGNSSLCTFGVALLAVWCYIIIVACRHMLHGWLLPITPLIIWILGKGLPNTLQLLSAFVPAWLIAFDGLPLVLLACTLIGLLKFLLRKK